MPDWLNVLSWENDFSSLFYVSITLSTKLDKTLQEIKIADAHLSQSWQLNLAI